MGKGTIGLGPYFHDGQVMHRPAVAGLLAVLVSFTDAKSCKRSSIPDSQSPWVGVRTVAVAVVLADTHAPAVVLGKHHWMLYWLVTAMYPQFLITLDEQLEDKAVTVRVGQAVNTIGLAGTRSGISGVSDDDDVDVPRMAHRTARLIWRVSQSTCVACHYSSLLLLLPLPCRLSLDTRHLTLVTSYIHPHFARPLTPHLPHRPTFPRPPSITPHAPLPSSNRTSAQRPQAYSSASLSCRADATPQFQTHQTPVRIGTGERAELGTNEFFPYQTVLEGLVILKK